MAQFFKFLLRHPPLKHVTVQQPPSYISGPKFSFYSYLKTDIIRYAPRAPQQLSLTHKTRQTYLLVIYLFIYYFLVVHCNLRQFACFLFIYKPTLLRSAANTYVFWAWSPSYFRNLYEDGHCTCCEKNCFTTCRKVIIYVRSVYHALHRTNVLRSHCMRAPTGRNTN